MSTTPRSYCCPYSASLKHIGEVGARHIFFVVPFRVLEQAEAHVSLHVSAKSAIDKEVLVKNVLALWDFSSLSNARRSRRRCVDSCDSVADVSKEKKTFIDTIGARSELYLASKMSCQPSQL